MSGQLSGQDLTSSQIIYINTIADAVRLVIDQYHLLGSTNPTTYKLLHDISNRWLLEQTRHRHMQPAGSFNKLASPATCRVAAASVMQNLATQTIEQAASLPGSDFDRIEAQVTAKLLVKDTLWRLLENKGMGDRRESPLQERRHFVEARRAVDARVFELRNWPSRRDYAQSWTQANGDNGLPDTPQRREQLLIRYVSHTLQWSVEQSLKLAERGENTAGRLTAAMGIPLQSTHLEYHEVMTQPAARCLRELQLTMRVLRADLTQPGGTLNTAALEDYHFRLQHMQWPAQPVDERLFARAARPALAFARRVDETLSRLVARNEGRLGAPKRALAAFISPSSGSALT